MGRVIRVSSLLLLLVSFRAHAWELKATETALEKPDFRVEIEKPRFVLHEPVGVKFVVENHSDQASLHTLLTIVSRPLEGSGINLDVLGPDGTPVPWFGVPRNMLLLRKAGGTGVMDPGERLTATNKVHLGELDPGDYSVRARYLWRGTDSSKASHGLDMEKWVAAEEVTVTITAARGVDRAAIEAVGDPRS